MKALLVSLVLSGGVVFGVTGKGRVVGHCHNIKNPSMKTSFELDSVNEPFNQDNILGHGKAGAYRLKAALWGAGRSSDYASSISFRLELAALKEEVGRDAAQSIASTYSAVDHRHFSFNKEEAEKGSDWKANFSGGDYDIFCEGKAFFQTTAHWVDLGDGKVHPLTEWDVSRMGFTARHLPEGKRFCGVRLTSNNPDEKTQRSLLAWIGMTNNLQNFYTPFGQVFDIRENVRSTKGKPSLKLQFQASGTYLIWETRTLDGKTKSSFLEFMQNQRFSKELFKTLEAQAIGCERE